MPLPIPSMKARRRIAAPRLRAVRTMLWNGAITAGIYDRRNGVRTSFCVATILRIECPLWVISGHFAKSGRCPLYPQKRTLVERVRMSALCQKET